MSHRGRDFIGIAESAEASLRELMDVPDDYRVLFLQGGATGQFAAIPMNLAPQDGAADYVITGMWGKRAHGEGTKYLDRVQRGGQRQPEHLRAARERLAAHSGRRLRAHHAERDHPGRPLRPRPEPSPSRWSPTSAR